MRQIEAKSPVWLMTMALAGMGCTFMGPYLPVISAEWGLHDRQAGLMLSSLFVGSFLGTLLLSGNLRLTLRLGACAATAGLLLFAWMSGRPTGFPVGAAALTVLGFGLGQLMSSINLLVGAAPLETRSRALAHVGSAWCLGAVISPLLVTVWREGPSPVARLLGFAFCFLLPLGLTESRTLPVRDETSGTAANGFGLRRQAAFWALVLLVYGGVEATVAGWMPMFAVRYRIGTETEAQLSQSVFWLGLIAGRTLTAMLVTPGREANAVRAGALGTACCLLWILAVPSTAGLLVGIACTGICLGPLFPLLLAMSLECRLGTQAMGAILAACGLGNAIFPSLLGLLSNAAGLRAGMFLPLGMLIVLLVLQTRRAAAHGSP